MVRKRPNPLDDPPAASSSEEEEDEELPEQHEEDKRPADASESEEKAVGDEDDQDEDEVDEDEPEKEKIRLPHKPVSKIPNPQSDESDTESESAGFALRPHTTTPASAAKPRNPLKRPVEGEKESKSKAKKKAKPDIGGGGEGRVAAKKSGSVRLWSEEDEIAVLKGMIEFHERKGVDPNSDSTAFHEFVKKSISFDVSKSQLMEKVRRLKNKYRYNAEKSEDQVFSRAHERFAFELSKTVWGAVGGNVVKNTSIKKKNSSADHNGNFDFGDEEGEIRLQHKPVSKIPEMKSGKKSGIVGMWSDEDEIAVLKGMIEFHEKKGVDPNSDSTAFYEFVKKSISVDVSKSQLMERVKGLKAKYILNAEKAEDPVFSRPHVRKAFELSKIVWGSAGADVVKKNTSSSDHNGKFDVVMALPNPNFTAFNTISKQKQHHSKVVEAVEVVEQGKFADLYPFLYLSLKSSSLAMTSRDMAETMERYLVSLDQSKLQELDKEWKRQILDEAQVSMGRSDLLKKQLQLLLADWHSTKG